jgi:uncharacterized membrane protein
MKRAPVPIVTDRPVAAVAAAALLVSLYLTATKLFASPLLFCEAGGGCDIVQASRWATLFGVPTAAWGAVVYAGVLALAVRGFTARRWLGAFLLAVVAAAASGYLTWIELAVLRAVCPYCLAVAAMTGALLVLLLVRRPHSVTRRTWGAPRRLAALAVVIATLVIVVSAAAFRVDTTFMASSDQEALARHLASSGAVFYGAFW